MIFYKVTGTLLEPQEEPQEFSHREERRRNRQLGIDTEEFNERLLGKAYICVSEKSDQTVTFIVLRKDEKIDPEGLAIAFAETVNMPLVDANAEEITYTTFGERLQNASMEDYIPDDDAVLERFGIDIGRGFDGGIQWAENLMTDRSKEELYKACDKYLAGKQLREELDRIFMRKTKTFHGNPVHYFIRTDDHDTRREMYRIVLDSLYMNGRLKNRRYCFMDFDSDAFINPREMNVLRALYKANEGGTIVIRYLPEKFTEGDTASNVRDTVEKMCEVMKDYAENVLTVFCIPRESTYLKQVFSEYSGYTTFVDIAEDFAKGDEAIRFLKQIASEKGVRTDKKLFSRLDPKTGYLSPELRSIFQEWLSIKLKTVYYPEYKDMESAKKEIQEKAPKGSAYAELMGMIGLTEAKKVITDALEFHKAQKLFKEKGYATENNSLHMVFTGNPGSAKTTVARLYARILKENGILSKGQLVEVGRDDLVGKYVGWSAVQTKQAFEKAKGGVLFVDEAYSICNSGNRDDIFGQEVIDTITKYLENTREDVCVIFAGYPDKMEEFLAKNPGLRSRCNFTVPFEDYDVSELSEIAEYIAKSKNLILSDGALIKMEEYFEKARKEPDFGNGRYVRNLIERSQMAQARRIVKMDLDKITDKDIRTILPEDIEVPNVKFKKKESKPIGFAS